MAPPGEFPMHRALAALMSLTQQVFAACCNNSARAALDHLADTAIQAAVAPETFDLRPPFEMRAALDSLAPEREPRPELVHIEQVRSGRKREQTAKPDHQR